MTDNSSEQPAKTPLSINRDDSQGAYLPASPGDPILAQDWNEMQLAIRKHIQTHTHAESLNEGVRLTGQALDPASTLSVKALEAETLRLTQKGKDRLVVDENGTVNLGDGGLVIHPDGRVDIPMPSIPWHAENKRSILTFARIENEPDGAFYEIGNFADDSYRIRRVWGGHTQTLAYRDELMISAKGRVLARTLPLVVGSQAHGPNQRIIRGTVTANGTKLRGEGFKVERFEDGRYRITFESPFPQHPVVVVTPQGYDEDGSEGGGGITCYTSLWIARVGPEGFSCVTGNQGNSDSRPADRRFHFIAIGELADG